MPSSNDGNRSENNRKSGVRRNDGRVTRSYNMNHSTIDTILKNKMMEHVKSAVPMMSTIMSKECGKAMEEIEKFLSVWMQDQHQR